MKPCLSILLFPVLFLSGCLLPPPTPDQSCYYRLTAIENRPIPVHAPLVVLEILEVPAYLEQPRFVTATNDSQWTFAEYSRWADNIRKNIQEVCCENLSQQLQSLVVSPSGCGPIQPQYSILLRLFSFCPYTDNTVHLDGNWSLVSPDGSLKQSQTFRIRIPCAAVQVPLKAVAAMSHALEQLTGEICEAIKK